MSGRRIIRHPVVAAMTLAMIGGSLLAVPGEAAATRIVQARRNASVALALPSGSRPKVVQSVTLASGPWTVMAKAFVVDLTSGESDYFRCDLYNATSNRSLDVSAGWVASDFPGNMITNMAKLKVAKGTTVTIDQQCWHDHTGIGHAYLDPGATLLAFKASSGTDNRLYRSTSAIDLPNADNNEHPATVASLGLSSGFWVFGFKATAVNSDGQDHIENSAAGRTLPRSRRRSTGPISRFRRSGRRSDSRLRPRSGALIAAEQLRDQATLYATVAKSAYPVESTLAPVTKTSDPWGLTPIAFAES